MKLNLSFDSYNFMKSIITKFLFKNISPMIEQKESNNEFNFSILSYAKRKRNSNKAIYKYLLINN
ncbi:hypothetical protein BpHYR1_011328 [Brachionus plicatilis]|uniref:Uncharacterized protein n=1 Tax=Brachionus plicatilis TaxID=10195 RepID=A0A3M7Q210_BRAPC|nr:hypothetical protein BpHYR1_011328 [Brachionus plicatilis]